LSDDVVRDHCLETNHLIAMRKVNRLILVHRRQLIDQWRERLARFPELSPKEIRTPFLRKISWRVVKAFSARL
jgi:superfamily II DNA or RNA helicase